MLRRITRSVDTHGLVSTFKKGSKRIKSTLVKRYHIAKKSHSVPSAYGVELFSNWGDTTFEACAMGSYGNFLSDYLASMQEPFAFVDIGANQGLYSLVAAKNPACSRAIALEPVSATFAILKKNIELNGLQGNVTPLQFGISTEEASLPIYKIDGHSGAASLQTHSEANGVISEIVNIHTAESLAAHLPSDQPIAIKIDVEGHELYVIRSLQQASFRDRISSIFCEVDERWIDAAEMNIELEKLGLRNFQKVGNGFHYDLLATRDPR